MTGKQSLRAMAFIAACALGAALVVAGCRNSPASSAEPQRAGVQAQSAGMPGMAMPSSSQAPGAQPSSGAGGPAEEMPGEVQISSRRQQISGVRTGEVAERQLTRIIRTVGLLQADETRVKLIHTKISGWVDQLYVNFTGQMVERGQPVLSIYSPDLVSAEEEYLLALRYKGQLKDSPLPDAAAGSESLARAAQTRLRYWDISQDQIRELEQRGEPSKDLVLHSPVKGFVTIKEAYQGKYITPEMALYTLTDMSHLWMYIDIYEYEIPLIKLGQTVTLTLSYFPGESFRGKVTYIYPTLDAQTRTNKVRVELANPGYKLKPDMYANAEVRIDLGKCLAVPEDAVLDSGDQQTVFLALDQGHFQPRRVRLGQKAEGYYEVLQGLRAGDRVVTSANFLIDSESRLKTALEGFTATPPESVGTGANQQGKTPAVAVQIKTEPSPLQRGRNTITVQVSDAGGKPLGGAELSVAFFKPGMPEMGMPPLREKAKAVERSAGVYAAEVNLDDGGLWQATITVRKGGAVIGGTQTEMSVGAAN
jgi:Cu(I)/Ag(I) efflux system membrane fusion protein